jgi:hypothetical protein
MELPKNKPAVNGKYKTKSAIQSAVYKLLAQDKIEGRYADENWSGIQKMLYVLHSNGVETEGLGAEYEGHGESQGSNLPTRKVYKYKLTARDKEGKNVPMNLKVTCAFIGNTGTMVDKQYELTYYFI